MRKGNEVVVGLVIIASMIVLAMGTLFLKGARFGQEFNHVEVLVSDVGQLMLGNDVKYRGVAVGSITHIRVTPGTNAVSVGMEVKEEIPIVPDAAVIIAPESLFGDWEAEIVSKSTSPRYEFYEVAPGLENDLGQRVIGGFAIPDISRLTATAEEVATNIGQLTARIDQAFNEETAEALGQAIRDIQGIAGSIRALVEQQSSNFTRMAVGVEETMGEVSRAAQAGRTSMEGFERLVASGRMDELVNKLDSTLTNMQRMSQNLEATTGGLGQTLVLVDSTLVSFRNITGMIENKEGTLGLLLSDSTVYNQFSTVMMRLDSLLIDLKANPGRYINLRVF